MTTYHPIVLKCPNCGTLLSAYDLMSYTVHNAESWSDGRTGFGIPSVERIGICADCRLPFWKDDAKLPDDPDWQSHEDLASVMDMYDLEWRFDDDRNVKTIDYFKGLLEDGFADTEDKEFYVRTQLWWAINDLIRYRGGYRSVRKLSMLTALLKHRRELKKLFNSYRDFLHKNLERLIFLFIKGEEPDLLYLAEMYRETGNFSKALEILDKVERHDRTWRKIRKMTKRKDSRVFEL